MSTNPPLAVVRLHASLNVSDMVRAVAFYRELLGCPPAKQRPDYAKFEIDEPPLVLSLIPGHVAGGGPLNHLGLRVRSPEELVSIQRRLEAGGIRTQREEGVSCCHSTQTKFWVTDPDRTLWEIYILHEAGEDACTEGAPGPSQAGSFARTLPREPVRWQHSLSDPLPLRIDASDNTVDEVLLEGTANGDCGEGALGGVLSEAFRVLRPGGVLRLHGLAADAPLPEIPIQLPGPAAAVRSVPAVAALAQALRAAGFVGIRFETLSGKAYFQVANTGLREILLLGRKPGHRPGATRHLATYLGPMSVVTDDLGNRFPRGERVALNIHDWLMLKNGPASADFLLLGPETGSVADEH